MLFQCWNEDLMKPMCVPRQGDAEADFYINHANLNALVLDGRFAGASNLLQTKCNLQRQALLLDSPKDVQDEPAPHMNAQAIALNGKRWFGADVDDNELCDILAQRVALDPFSAQELPHTLTCRLSACGIGIAEYASAIHSLEDDSSVYSHTPKKWHLPLIDAIKVVGQTLTEQHLKSFNLIINQGRLRLVEPGSLGNACVVCSAGALIQLEHHHGRVDVLALSHEVGHALHMQHRWSQAKYWPADVVTSEACAIAMELHLLKQSSHAKPVGLWQQQLAFYGPWHAALHAFELGLYSLSPINPKQLDAFWRFTTKGFNAREGGWRWVQHLYTSPFYLVCYPLALARQQHFKWTH